MKPLMVLIAALFVSSAAFAQEQTGVLQGRITDSSGGVLPGVTVEAKSPALVGSATAVTGRDGIFRFPALSPGRYSITATLAGFKPAAQDTIVLELGQLLKVNLTLEVGAVTETVMVKGESPLIDVRQNSAGANVAHEIIARIPKGRDFTTVITSSAGITDEARSFGIQIDGSSGADNRFMVDGVDTTNLRTGQSGKSVAADFVSEVQVKQTGYSAEYRASIGGVVSAITKTGSNRWSGGFGGYHTTESLQGRIRPSLRLNPSNQTVAEYFTSPADEWYNAEIVAELGGPAVKDRVWFYVGSNSAPARTERTVTFRDSLAAGPRTFVNSTTPFTMNGNVTAQLAKQLRGKFSTNILRQTGGFSLPSIEPDGTSTANSSLFPAVVRSRSYNDTYSLSLDWVPNNRTYANVTGTYLGYGSKDVGQFSNVVVHSFSGSNFQFPEIPADLRHISGYADNRSSSENVGDNYFHANVNANVTRYMSWLGQHTIKTGIQFERLGAHLLTGAQQPSVTFFWDASRAANDGTYQRGTYGYYSVSRTFSSGDPVANNWGLFVQDAWTLNKNLTLNLGVRSEREYAPSYREENPGIQFGFADKIAPRVGFAWDIKGDSRWKAYGSWGMYHDLMKLGLGYVMFGATRSVAYYYQLDTYDWQTIGAPGGYPPSGAAYPGKYIDSYDGRTIANRPDSTNMVDPDLHPIRMQEATGGLDHELGPSLSVGVRYTHKWVDYAIEAVCSLWGGQELCGVNNPGYGLFGGTGQSAVYPWGPDYPKQPPAIRNYDGLEFKLRKRFGNRWSGEASYLLSRLWGNWSGIAGTDEAYSGLQPYAGRNFDFLYYNYDTRGAYDPVTKTGLNETTGRLGTDRPHQFKFQGTYDFPWGTQIGLNYLITSGTPPTEIISYRPGINVMAWGRNNLPRYPTYSKTDLLIQQGFPLPGHARLSVGLNAQNLFDQRIVTGRGVTPYRDQFFIPDAKENFGFFRAPWDPAAVAAANPAIRPNALYGLASTYQPRRVIRLQAKISF